MEQLRLGRRTAICFSAADCAFAEELHSYLGQQTSLQVELVACELATDFLDTIEQCLGHDFLIVVLSPNSLPKPWPRQLWEPVLVDAARDSSCHIAYVLLASCLFPSLLRRHRFFDFAKNINLAALRSWAIHLLDPDRMPPLALSGVPDPSLIPLIDSATCITGVSSDSAEGFVSAHWKLFDHVTRVKCGRATRAALVGEIGFALQLKLSESADQNWITLLYHASEDRDLYIFENLPSEFQDLADLGGKVSCIVLNHDATPTASLSDLKRAFFAPDADEAEAWREFGKFIDDFDRNCDWDELKSVAFRALQFLKREARLAEAHELLLWFAALAKQNEDVHSASRCQSELFWISNAWDSSSVAGSQIIQAEGSQLSLFDS